MIWLVRFCCPCFRMLRSAIVALACCLCVILSSACCADSLVDTEAIVRPTRPKNFASPDDLRVYLDQLGQYYAVVGRPRFVVLTAPHLTLPPSSSCLMMQLIQPSVNGYFSLLLILTNLVGQVNSIQDKQGQRVGNREYRHRMVSVITIRGHLNDSFRAFQYNLITLISLQVILIWFKFKTKFSQSKGWPISQLTNTVKKIHVVLLSTFYLLFIEHEQISKNITSNYNNISY